MDERNVPDSSPNRTRRVLSLALWLVLILVVAIGISWLAKQSVHHAVAPKEDFANLFHIEAIVSDEYFAFSIKDRRPTSDSKRWCEASVFLISGNDKRKAGGFSGHVGSSSNILSTFRDQARDKPVSILIEYRVFDDSGPPPPGPVVTPPSGPLLYEGRQASQIIDLPAIAREQPGWAKGSGTETGR